MKTSKINIPPFKPFLLDEEKEGREPFAVLKYGNVTIELDYTLMLSLNINNESACMVKTTGLAMAGFDEIIKEMHFDMNGSLPSEHRDARNPKSLTHDPLHPSNEEVTYSHVND